MRSCACGPPQHLQQLMHDACAGQCQAAAAHQKQPEVVTRPAVYNPLSTARAAKARPAAGQTLARDAMAAATNLMAAEATQQPAPAAPTAATRRVPLRTANAYPVASCLRSAEEGQFRCLPLRLRQAGGQQLPAHNCPNAQSINDPS